MRQDEEAMMSMIRDTILSRFYPECIIEEGEDPPDYIIKTNNKTIALELTNISDLVEENGTLTNSNEFLTPIENIFNKIDIKYSSSLNPNEKLLFKITIPLLSPSKFKSKINKSVESLLSHEYLKMSEGSFIIGEDNIKWKKINTPKNTSKIMLMLSHNNNHSISVSHNISNMLLHSIIKKNNKMKKIDTSLISEKWLCLKSDYPFDSEEIYSNVMHNLDTKHDFTKIIIIDNKNNVLQYNFSS